MGSIEKSNKEYEKTVQRQTSLTMKNQIINEVQIKSSVDREGKYFLIGRDVSFKS